MTEPGQPGYAGPAKPAPDTAASTTPSAAPPSVTDPRTLAPKMVGQTQDDQADNAALNTPGRTTTAEDLSAKAASLENELASVRAQASGQATVNLKVEGVHSAFIHNGLMVTDEFTAVPEHAVGAMMEAASESGVSLVQEEV